MRESEMKAERETVIRIKNGAEIRILPLKKLSSVLSEKKTKGMCLAIVLSAGDVTELRQKGIRKVLHVPVHDTENPRSPFAFGRREAVMVKKFIDENCDFDTLFVCCDSGESRSTALAAATARYLGAREMPIWTNPFYHPNMLIYSEQCKTFEICVPSLYLRYLRYINDRSLQRAVKASSRKRTR